jgi:type IV secretory pathway VirB2 component (pilin)
MTKRISVEIAATLSIALTSPAAAQDSYSHPDGSNALVSAVSWLGGILLGPVATVVAVIGVATIGFMMLTGQIDIRRAVRVIFGCFIIFGASTIAHGIMDVSPDAKVGPDLAAAPPPTLPQSRPNSNANATPYDPYAGAALPPR